MSTRINRTGQIYGQLTALCDTGKTKESNRVWSARCTCGRVIETHQLGRKKGPKRCLRCAVTLFCQPRDITGQVFAGWKAIKRVKRDAYKSDIWQLRCLGCGRRVRRNAASLNDLRPCRKCNPLPPRPQKPTTTGYPALTAQIAALRIKLAGELSAGQVIEVPVGGGRYSALVDARDAPNVLFLRWYVRPSDNDTYYADTKIAGKDVPMHRIILGLTDPKVAGDHKDHCGVNNTRENLRPATEGQNAANRRKSRKKAHSRYKGVTRQSNTKSKPWMAYIHDKVDGKRKMFHLGRFADEADAARAYNAAAVERFGEFACLNDVLERKPPVSVGFEQISVA
jgi:hypothetical protein